MKAFHNDPLIKEKYIQRIKAHTLADQIIKGIYWENGKGCAVGCTIHNSEHGNYEIELGIPIILARVEDGIFEKLPNELAKTWPLRFLESINVGADLSKIWDKFAIFLLTDKSQCNSIHPQCNIIAEAFEAQLNNEKIDWIALRKNASVAYDSAASAEAVAYAKAASYASYASAEAVAYASYASYASVEAAYAVYASAKAAAASAEAAVYRIKIEQAIIIQSEKLLELLKETK